MHSIIQKSREHSGSFKVEVDLGAPLNGLLECPLLLRLEVFSVRRRHRPCKPRGGETRPLNVFVRHSLANQRHSPAPKSRNTFRPANIFTCKRLSTTAALAYEEPETVGSSRVKEKRIIWEARKTATITGAGPLRRKLSCLCLHIPSSVVSISTEFVPKSSSSYLISWSQKPAGRGAKKWNMRTDQ